MNKYHNYLNSQQNWALAAANRAERPLRGQLRGPCGAFIVGPSKPEYPCFVCIRFRPLFLFSSSSGRRRRRREKVERKRIRRFPVVHSSSSSSSSSSLKPPPLKKRQQHLKIDAETRAPSSSFVRIYIERHREINSSSNTNLCRV